MLEQKLFFTRNGEYTIWEKINLISGDKLDLILEIIKESGIELSDEEFKNVSKESIIYKVYTMSGPENQYLKELINQYFSVNNADKMDFNGNLFKVDLGYIDVEIGYMKLKELEEKDCGYSQGSLITNVFLRREIDCVDIRLSSKKRNNFKENSNEQFINTEMRIYFNYGFILMTDFSEFTHNKSIKSKLIENVKNLIDITNSGIYPYRFSDVALRVLLKKSKKNASKFKFSIDDCINVGVDVSEDIGDNPLQHKGLREFYDKHPIFLIKIAMSSDEDKYITIDGQSGKLTCRSKSMEVKDIDLFVGLLSEVIKYDYLNIDYLKEIKDKAKRKLVGPSLRKLAQVDDMDMEIRKNIRSFLGDVYDVDTGSIIRNVFLYCLVNKILIKENKKVKFQLDTRVVRMMSSFLDIDFNKISETFDFIVNLAINNNDNVLEVFDQFISQKGELNVNQV